MTSLLFSFGFLVSFLVILTVMKSKRFNQQGKLHLQTSFTLWCPCWYWSAKEKCSFVYGKGGISAFREICISLDLQWLLWLGWVGTEGFPWCWCSLESLRCSCINIGGTLSPLVLQDYSGSYRLSGSRSYYCKLELGISLFPNILTLFCSTYLVLLKRQR